MSDPNKKKIVVGVEKRDIIIFIYYNCFLTSDLSDFWSELSILPQSAKQNHM